jgi:hypothetical protein
LIASPTPSGSSGFLLSLSPSLSVGAGLGAAVSPASGSLVGSVAGAVLLALALGLALADGVSPGCGVSVCAGLSGVVPELGVAVGDDGLAEGDFDSEASGSGVSERVTQGPGAKGFVTWSSASASFGVSPMPTNTAVGIAARAIALPAGICSFVRSDFLGAA